MNIDGHAIRVDSIDAVTEPEFRFDSVHEGTDQIARGKFEIYIRGQKLLIGRGKRCYSDDASRLAAMKIVQQEVREIWHKVEAEIP